MITTDSEEEHFTIEEAFDLLIKGAQKSDRLSAQMLNNVVNPVELAKALGVRPQMIYNYIRDGKVRAYTDPKTQHKLIDLLEAAEFVRKYMNRKAEQQQRIERELRGE